MEFTVPSFLSGMAVSCQHWIALLTGVNIVLCRMALGCPYVLIRKACFLTVPLQASHKSIQLPRQQFSSCFFFHKPILPYISCLVTKGGVAKVLSSFSKDV